MENIFESKENLKMLKLFTNWCEKCYIDEFANSACFVEYFIEPNYAKGRGTFNCGKPGCAHNFKFYKKYDMLVLECMIKVVYKCFLCKERHFNSPDDVSIHRAVDHSFFKFYDCKICCGIIHCKHKHGEHIIEHLKEKSFECPLCGSTFKCSRYLDTHLRKISHEGIRI